ncbi:hypothetical protein LSTR_LSTR001914 [Laodelphax striatellus]|uniref:Peptidase S1 domain-containing protein n=1 Tax=Laodelphax striatellus TaxID=195883 RepID=A0A482XGM3_LAOST|nr:hypothetical protein LSTR_LSTR001914 [Laodelphax striatellus]
MSVKNSIMIPRSAVIILLTIILGMAPFSQMQSIDDDSVVVNSIDNNDLRENNNNDVNTVTTGNPRISDVLINSQGRSCICVPFYQCSINNTLITDGAGIIDIRSKQESLCQHYLDVCCEHPEQGGNPVENKEDKIGGQPDLPLVSSTSSPFVNQQKEGCGWRHTGGVRFRITGDLNNESQFGEFPWMIALLVNNHVNENTTLKIFQCGASLIHPQVALTAAHCIKGRNTNDLIIRAGEWDTQKKMKYCPTSM